MKCYFQLWEQGNVSSAKPIYVPPQIRLLVVQTGTIDYLQFSKEQTHSNKKENA